MPGETDLGALLAGLDPVLHDDVLVWCTVPLDDPAAVAHVPAFARIAEDEGVTLIVTAETAARHGWPAEMPSRRIEMRVHSALEAVGMTAAMSTALAAAGISANVVAAFHHDHILVPAADADRALAVLRALAADHTGTGAWTTILDGDIGISLRVAAEQPDPDLPLVDVRLVVRGGVVSADIESVWWDEQLDDLVAALDAIAGGDLTERMVDGMRGPTIWFRSRGLVDGLWEVVVTASGSSIDSSAMIATSFDRHVCLDAAARVRALRDQIS